MTLNELATPEGAVFYMQHRYHTADPFTLCDYLNIGIHWVDLPDDLIGRTTYFHGRPVIALDKSIKHRPIRYNVLSHELGHSILHAGVATAYHQSGGGDKMEYQADVFASTLLTCLYREEFGCLPRTASDLKYEYGVEYM